MNPLIRLEPKQPVVFKAVFLILFLPPLLWSNATASPYTAKFNTAQWVPIELKTSAGADATITAATFATAITFYVMEGLSVAPAAVTLTAGDGTTTGLDCATDGTESPEPGDVCAIDTTNFPGLYKVRVAATSVDTKGKVIYQAKGTGYMTYNGLWEVQTYYANEESDKFPASGTISTPATAQTIDMAQACPATPTAGTTGDACKTSADSTAQTGDAFARLGAPSGASIAADIATKSSQTSVDTVAGYVDTEVAAIKTKTDQLTFTTPNQVDSRTMSMANDVVTAAAIATGALTCSEFAAGVVFAKCITVGANSNVAKIISADLNESDPKAWVGHSVWCATQNYSERRKIHRFDPTADTIFFGVNQVTPVGDLMSSAPVNGTTCVLD